MYLPMITTYNWPDYVVGFKSLHILINAIRNVLWLYYLIQHWVVSSAMYECEFAGMHFHVFTPVRCFEYSTRYRRQFYRLSVYTRQVLKLMQMHRKERLGRVILNILTAICLSTFWKSTFKQQLGCWFDIMDCKSSFFVFWYMQLYMS